MTITIDYVGPYEPHHGSGLAAGYDLKAVLEKPITIRPGESRDIPTGIHAQPPAGCAGLLFIRSGTSKRDIRLSTCVSIIDPDYTGDIVCRIRNSGNKAQTVYDGDRIAQIMYVTCAEVIWNKVDALHPTERGDGGFGSTGR